MKKFSLLLITFLLFLTGCANSSPKKADMSNYTGLTTENHRFLDVELTQGIRKLTNKEPGVYYIGYSGCPWCQALIPHLNQNLEEADKDAYYLNLKGTNVDEQTAKKAREDINEFLSQYGSSYVGVPLLIVVNEDGSIKEHVGTLNTHNATERELTEYEIVLLNKVLKELLK